MDLPVVDVFRDAIGLVIRLEQTISFILKLIVVVLFLVIGGSWMMATLQEFFYGLFDLMKG